MIQLLIHLKIDAYGERWDRSNLFHWERVILNLPGTKGYQTGLPWVMKVRFDSHLAYKVYIYVDDGRVAGHCRELCWAAGRRFALVCSKQGVHDASRKQTFPADGPGPWAGGRVCHTSGGGIIGTVSQEMWEKTQLLVG